MKKYSFIYLIFFALSFQFTFGQTYHWNRFIDSAKHNAGVNFGWEYAMNAGINYSYRLPVKRPIILQSGFSLPFGKNVIDDFKTNLGLRTQLIHKNKYYSIISLDAIYKRFSNELVTINQLSFDFKSINGYYKSKWFIAAEVGLELGISSHFKHTEIYKQNIYSAVQDGWYQPLSAGILNLGVQTGFTFKQNNLNLRIGYLKSITSPENSMIPYYFSFGYNRMFK